MVVEIMLELFNTPTVFRDLDLIVQWHFEGEETARHSWYIKDDPEDISNSLWLQGESSRLGQMARRLVDKYFTDSIYYGSDPHLTVSLSELPDQRYFSPTSAKTILDCPLMLLVENSENDSKFFNAIVRSYDSNDEFRDAFSKKWWGYEHAGGMTQFPVRIRQIIEKLPPGAIGLRLFVLLDSDLKAKKVQGNPHKQEIENVITLCESNGIPYHILKKREIENYLPNELLQLRIPETHQKTVAELLKLNEEQRDYYDLEKGFSRKNPGIFDAIQKGSDAYKCLIRGFDRDDFKAKQELPKLFEDESLNSDMLERRCKPEPKELKKLLKNFKKLL
jgi:hypothetical protein